MSKRNINNNIIFQSPKNLPVVGEGGFSSLRTPQAVQSTDKGGKLTKCLGIGRFCDGDNAKKTGPENWNSKCTKLEQSGSSDKNNRATNINMSITTVQ